MIRYRRRFWFLLHRSKGAFLALVGVVAPLVHCFAVFDALALQAILALVSECRSGLCFRNALPPLRSMSVTEKCNHRTHGSHRLWGNEVV
jgi:hypothetical protein